MDFLKAHYEKIILSIVLLGLAGAAAWMPIKVSQERQEAEQRKIVLITPKVKEIQPVDLTTNTVVLGRLEQPTRLKFQGEHNLFNPVRWQKRPDGGLLKASDAGINAIEVTSINPLRLRVEFEEVSMTTATPAYRLSVLNELQRSTRPTPRIAGLKQQNNMFVIEEVIGPAENPDRLKVLLAGDKQPVIISRDKPYERIVGYAADLRYPPEDKTWKNQKPKDEISFGGEMYNIVAITENEVVLSARSNKKQTVLEYKPLQK
jgi:hypothetical protein